MILSSHFLLLTFLHHFFWLFFHRVGYNPTWLNAVPFRFPTIL
jgi:hypothetical protein